MKSTQGPDLRFHEELGPISVESGTVRVTDPCYASTSAGVHVIDVVPGDYRASYGREGGYVREVAIVHSNYNTRELVWNEHLESVGVDSGQCGFCDAEQYPKGGTTGDYEDTTSFYGRVCAGTLSELSAALLPYAVFTSSGWGDGSYPVYYALDSRRRVVALAIVFMSDDMDDIDDEWGGEDEDDADDEWGEDECEDSDG